MKITRIFSFDMSMLLLLGVVNFLIFSHVYPTISQTYITLFFFLVPGALLTKILNIQLRNIWNLLVLICGLSVSFLMFSGLFANFILPALGVLKPLEAIHFLPFFDILFLVGLLISHFSTYKEPSSLSLPHLSMLDYCFMGISLLFPFLSIFGAIELNNNGSNIITLIFLTVLPIVLIGLIVFQEKLSEHTYYWYILNASISLLLMLSLRSWHITGSDIHDEFRIFQMTKNAGWWDYSFNHAYNACLSITILPTLISNLAHIPDEFVFKFILQIFFGLTPIILFSLYKNFSNKVISLLTIFYILAQPFFIQPMTGLVRQEVALFFFGLILFILFDTQIKKYLANILFIIFGLSMIVSHYSTTYIAIGLFTATFICISIYNTLHSKALLKKVITSVVALKFDIHITKTIQAIPLLILLFFTYFWYFQFTQTSGNLITTIKSSTLNLKDIFTTKKKSGQAMQVFSLFTAANTNNTEAVQRFVSINQNNFAKSTIPTYKAVSHAYPINDITLSSHADLQSTRIINLFLSIVRLVTKSVIFLSPFVLLFIYLRKHLISAEYIIFVIIGLGLVGLVILHPTLGDAYNLSRIYLQILMVAALGGVLFLFDCLFSLKFLAKSLLVTVLFVSMFTLHTGLSAQLIGGVPYMHLNNFGGDYDKFYVHQEEVSAAKWLGKNESKDPFIFTDEFASLRLSSFGNITGTIPIVLPSAMYKSSYVYADYANVKRLRTDGQLGGLEVIYSYPFDFLQTNKNLIYSNGGSQIFQ